MRLFIYFSPANYKSFGCQFCEKLKTYYLLANLKCHYEFVMHQCTSAYCISRKSKPCITISIILFWIQVQQIHLVSYCLHMRIHQCTNIFASALWWNHHQMMDKSNIENEEKRLFCSENPISKRWSSFQTWKNFFSFTSLFPTSSSVCFLKITWWWRKFVMTY